MMHNTGNNGEIGQVTGGEQYNTYTSQVNAGMTLYQLGENQ